MFVVCGVCKEREYDYGGSVGRDYLRYVVNNSLAVCFCSEDCRVEFLSRYYPNGAKIILEHNLGIKIYRYFRAYANQIVNWERITTNFGETHSIKQKEELFQKISELYAEWRESPKYQLKVNEISLETIILATQRIVYFSYNAKDFCFVESHNRQIPFEFPNGELGNLCLDCNMPKGEFPTFAVSKTGMLYDVNYSICTQISFAGVESKDG